MLVSEHLAPVKGEFESGFNGQSSNNPSMVSE